ncbi:cytokine receptor family member B12 [Brienomyrus brachyistius]|uniref:cytokine receptor family member B12 n=1 Tax=Brienomyrus brachyistius TaxID=42636 RepID=UPI0020B25EC0|nr:cytokine receptor family member B12 [Brienomyrus brachyistius]XP_048839292.1 cytokine receptor family member B12 [Brienomyrus brachyistius]
MTWSPVAIGFVLLFDLLNCTGELSLPQNLTVDLLDFQAYIHWSHAQGNLPDTRFTVELQECGTCSWTAIENCTQKTSTQCHFTFPMDTDELMKQYFLKIVAASGTESAEETYPRSFQPYGDSIISAPQLKVSVQNQFICVEMWHHLELMLSQLNYSINITKVTQDESVLVVSSTAVSPWMFPTTQLPPGQYCVSCSVFHKQQMQIHRQSKRCVSLELPVPGSGGQYLKVVVPFLLVGPLTVLILAAVYYHTRPKHAVRDMPMSLDPSDMKSMVTTMTLPMEVISPLLDLHALSTSMGGCSEPPAKKLASSWNYTARGTSLYQSDISASLLSPGAEGLAESRSPSLESMYRQVLDDNLSCDLGGATHSQELPLDELEGDATSQAHWLLVHDVPLDSLVLGLRDTQSDKTHESYQRKDGDDEGGLPNEPDPSELRIPPELHSPLLSFPSGYEARDPVVPIS